MEKTPYIKPTVEKVAIDNEISVILMSTGENTDPGETIQPPQDIPPMG